MNYASRYLRYHNWIMVYAMGQIIFQCQTIAALSLNKNIDARLYDDDFMKNCELLLIFE